MCFVTLYLLLECQVLDLVLGGILCFLIFKRYIDLYSSSMKSNSGSLWSFVLLLVITDVPCCLVPLYHNSLQSVELECLALYLDSDICPWNVGKPWENLLPSEWSEVW